MNQEAEFDAFKQTAADKILSAERRYLQMNLSLTKSKIRAYEQLLRKLELDFRAQLYEAEVEKERLLSEKNQCYRNLEDLKEQLERAYSEKQSAYDDLESAKSDVSSWHAKSKRSFFGNAGKPLPKHSLFGQSFGDLDSAKGRRSQAVSDIASSKRDIGRLKQERNECYGRIKAVKLEIGEVLQQIRSLESNLKDQAKLFEAGYTVSGLQGDISFLESELMSFESEIEALASRKCSIVLELSDQAALS